MKQREPRMTALRRWTLLALLIGIGLLGCDPASDDDDNDDDSAGDDDAGDDDAGDDDAGDDDTAGGGLVCAEGADGDELEIADDAATEHPVGFEILEVVGPGEIKAWAGQGVTQEQFDAIELSLGWIKNQPRETDMDGGEFARSPDATKDGEFDDQEHYGLHWRHVATIFEVGIQLDDGGLLEGNRVRKFHTLTWHEDRALVILVSPEGDQYVRVSRDADRPTDWPTIPGDWRKVVCVTPEELTLPLPDEILNIRCDNEDSFQGPIPALDLGI